MGYISPNFRKLGNKVRNTIMMRGPPSHDSSLGIFFSRHGQSLRIPKNALTGPRQRRLKDHLVDSIWRLG